LPIAIYEYRLVALAQSEAHSPLSATLRLSNSPRRLNITCPRLMASLQEVHSHLDEGGLTCASHNFRWRIIEGELNRFLDIGNTTINTLGVPFLVRRFALPRARIARGRPDCLGRTRRRWQTGGSPSATEHAASDPRRPGRLLETDDTSNPTAPPDGEREARHPPKCFGTDRADTRIESKARRMAGLGHERDQSRQKVIKQTAEIPA
jgi:hypothetical protein